MYRSDDVVAEVVNAPPNKPPPLTIQITAPREAWEAVKTELGALCGNATYNIFCVLSDLLDEY